MSEIYCKLEVLPAVTLYIIEQYIRIAYFLRKTPIWRGAHPVLDSRPQLRWGRVSSRLLIPREDIGQYNSCISCSITVSLWKSMYVKYTHTHNTAWTQTNTVPLAGAEWPRADPHTPANTMGTSTHPSDTPAEGHDLIN